MSCIPLGTAQTTLKFHNIPARVVVDARVDNPDVSRLQPYFLVLELEVKGQPPPPYDSIEVDVDATIVTDGQFEVECYKQCIFWSCSWTCSRVYGGATAKLSFTGVKISNGVAKVQADLVRAIVQAAGINTSKPFYAELSTKSAKVNVSVFFSGPYGRALAGSYSFDVQNFSGEVRSTIGQGVQGPSNCDEGCPGSCSQCSYASQGYTCREIQTSAGTYCCCTKSSTGTPQSASNYISVASIQLPLSAEPGNWYDFALQAKLANLNYVPTSYIALEYADGPASEIVIIDSRAPTAQNRLSKGRRYFRTADPSELKSSQGVINFGGRIYFPASGSYTLKVVAGYYDGNQPKDTDSKSIGISVKQSGGQPPQGSGCPSGYTCVSPMLCPDPNARGGSCQGPLGQSFVCCKQSSTGPIDSTPKCDPPCRVTTPGDCRGTYAKDLGNGQVCCCDVVNVCPLGYECVPADKCTGDWNYYCQGCGSSRCVCCKKQPQPSPSPSPGPSPSPTTQPQPSCPPQTPCLPANMCAKMCGTAIGSCQCSGTTAACVCCSIPENANCGGPTPV